MDFISSTHPLAPPTQEADLVAWLRLIRSHRVGNSTFYRLMQEHGDAHAALAALPDIASKAGLAKYTACTEAAAIAEIRKGRAIGAQLLAIGQSKFPATLAQISDPPPLLWARGDLNALSRPAVAVVGARNASSLGVRTARKLAGDLGAQGYCIVSGLARGIDTAAHHATLETGTVAVLAGGIDVVYPAENAELAQDITKTGVLISEQPIGTKPQARHFPRRNRLISGLARGVVVIEAAAKSGSLITAKDALDQGREILAVPGHPFDPRASGCNILIRDGATLVRYAEDVIEAIAEPAANAPTTEHVPEQIDPAPQGDDLQSRILDCLGPSPIAEDQLIRDLNIPAQVFSAELLSLELEGRVERRPGGLLALAG